MDIEHHYIEKGQSGPPLILLHGNGEDCAYFSGQMDAFAQRFRVYAPDTRGHGRTPRGTAPFTIRQFAEDLLGFMDRLGLEKAHILGFSDGANVAMIFAMTHPERVDRLILNGGNLDPRGVKRATQFPIEVGYWIARRFSRRSEGARAHAELLGLMVNDPNVDPAALKVIRARTLVVAGTRDMIREDHTRLLAASIPQAELAFLPGDHFVAHKNPAAFNALVLSFLTDGKEREVDK